MVLYSDISKNTNIKQFMFGDFDKDGVKNIDDPKPFNPKVSKYPDQKNNQKYYHTARYGGGEVLLSEELQNIENHNNDRQPILKNFLHENKTSFGRIKTVPSTMKKLRTRYISNIKDIAGVTILTDNRKKANIKQKSIKKKYKYDVKETDNFYKNPKGGVYYAHHIGLVDPKNEKLRLEVQVKSKKMFKLHKKMHIAYKKGESLSKFKKPAKKLYNKGY